MERFLKYELVLLQSLIGKSAIESAAFVEF
jgi:hypothetical protein